MTPRQSPRRARARQILRELAEIGYALPGSIVRRTTACGKPGCRCRPTRPSCTGRT